MQTALHITTNVLPGGKVELQLPPTTVGNEVEVFVILPEQKAAEQPILDFFAEIHRQGPFRTPEETDRDIQLEKQAWDS
jgi:hypothetical protein